MRSPILATEVPLGASGRCEAVARPAWQEVSAMNDLASAKLCEIVAQYGPGVCDEPRRSAALLADLCPGMPRQVNTLVAAAEQQVVAEAAARRHRTLEHPGGTAGTPPGR